MAAYTTPRLASIVGDDQIAAPAGPDSVVPSEPVPLATGSSGMAKAFQICSPVAASSATTLP